MNFSTEREAKEYLIGQIVAEAQKEGVTLTDIERKMLYFSETGWTSPDMMGVNAQFERDYDNAEYERKILGLASSAEERAGTVGGDDLAAWDDAVAKLSEGDHYLIVLINPRLVTESVRPPGDIKRLILTALACSIGLLALIALLLIFRDSRSKSVLVI